MIKVGFQVSIAGRIYQAVEQAESLGCRTMQIFNGNPRSWERSKRETADVEKFVQLRRKAKISPLFVHATYLINPASPEEGLYHRSLAGMAREIRLADKLEAEYFVIHPGSHRGRGVEFGVRRLAEALNIVIGRARPRLRILIENTAGSGSWLGAEFPQIGEVIRGVEREEKVGFCFDTGHAFSAGYDLSSSSGIETTLGEIEKVIGFRRLKVIHLNDSLTGLGSRIDRHEHIGRGKIGSRGLALLLCHPRLKGRPFILETPRRSEADDRRNLARVKELYESGKKELSIRRD